MAKKKRNRNKKGRTGKKSSSALQNSDYANAKVGNENANSRDVFAEAMPNMDRTFKEFETEILLQEFENLSPEEQEEKLDEQKKAMMTNLMQGEQILFYIT